MSAEVHLAQVNIARMNTPLDSAEMAGFVARIDEINALADASAGFVWRLQTGTADASGTYLRPYDDDRILFNLSVWRTVEDLGAYVYRSVHAEIVRRRHEWFGRLSGSALALWWIRAGHLPSVQEAMERLVHLEQNGPTPAAFTFKSLFAPG